MKGAYAVDWREGGTERHGRLEIGAHAIRLLEAGNGHGVLEELSLDDIESVEVRATAGEPGHPVVVLARHDAPSIQIESIVERWIVNDLVAKLLAHGLDAGHGRRRTLVAAKLKPGCTEAARALLRSGPPFDPTHTSLLAHDVFLGDDEVLFLFETGDAEPFEGEPHRLWEAAGAWHELLTGEIRRADRVYSWVRRDDGSHLEHHFGLGF